MFYGRKCADQCTFWQLFLFLFVASFYLRTNSVHPKYVKLYLHCVNLSEKRPMQAGLFCELFESNKRFPQQQKKNFQPQRYFQCPATRYNALNICMAFFLANKQVRHNWTRKPFHLIYPMVWLTAGAPPQILQLAFSTPHHFRLSVVVYSIQGQSTL